MDTEVLRDNKITKLNWTKTLPKEPIYDMMSGRSKETDKRDYDVRI